MNKVMLMGRLTRKPEISWNEDDLCIARFTLAVDRRFKREGSRMQTLLAALHLAKAQNLQTNGWIKESRSHWKEESKQGAIQKQTGQKCTRRRSWQKVWNLQKGKNNDRRDKEDQRSI